MVYMKIMWLEIGHFCDGVANFAVESYDFRMLKTFFLFFICFIVRCTDYFIKIEKHEIFFIFMYIRRFWIVFFFKDDIFYNFNE